MAEQASKKLSFSYGDISFDFAIAESETIISETIEKQGAWEIYQLSHYQDWLPENGVFIDVGANIGINSLFARHVVPTARIISVEPGPNNLALLRQNIAGTSIELFPVALGHEPGQARFTDRDNTRGKFSGTGEHEVAVTTLDRLCAQNNIAEIDLLKVDVEGYADQVFHGARETLPRVTRAIVEFSIEDAEIRLKSGRAGAIAHFLDLHAQLTNAFEYSYYISREDGLIEISSSSDIFEMMALEYDVADILFTRRPEAVARTVSGFLASRIKVLLTQNHYRIQEIAQLNKQVSELRDLLPEADSVL